MFSRAERYRSYGAGADGPGPFGLRHGHAWQFVERFFFISGALILAVWAAHAAQARIRQELLERRLAELQAAAEDGAADGTSVAPVLPSSADPIGRIEIPGRDVSSPILSGIDKAALDVAVGQVPGTAGFRDRGNVVLAGHRDTHFRGLRDIAVGDRITIETTEGQLAYEVVWTKVTTPQDVEVMDPTGDDVLTLVTCFPFYYIGSAPNRFVVRASRVVTDTGALPAGLLPNPPAP